MKSSKQILKVLIFVVISVQWSVSQSCLPDGIMFHVQADVDSFPINYPGCSIIEGDVMVNNQAADLGLYLTNLQGLSSIVSIEGNLLIEFAGSLHSLDGLQGLKYVGGGIRLFSTGLSSMVGLQNLDSIGGGFSVWYNFGLESFEGLSHLKKMGGDFYLLKSRPKTLHGLEHLQKIGGNLALFSNEMENLNGLDSLREIDGGIVIANNEKLTDISGIRNIAPTSIHPTVSSEHIQIYGNPLLSECSIASVCQTLAIPGTSFKFENNMPGCNSIGDVNAKCLVGAIEYKTGLLDVFPNPASDQAIVSFVGDQEFSGCSVYIFNQLGVLVLSQKSNILDLRGLKKGVYYVEIVKADKIGIKKLIIE